MTKLTEYQEVVRMKLQVTLLLLLASSSFADQVMFGPAIPPTIPYQFRNCQGPVKRAVFSSDGTVYVDGKLLTFSANPGFYCVLDPPKGLNQ